jgi:hypothetical protein
VPKIDANVVLLAWLVPLFGGLARLMMFFLWLMLEFKSSGLGSVSAGISYPSGFVFPIGPFVGWVGLNIYGEFDPGSGRTLAACLTHASRTVIRVLVSGDQWRTGE